MKRLTSLHQAIRSKANALGNKITGTKNKSASGLSEEERLFFQQPPPIVETQRSVLSHEDQVSYKWALTLEGLYELSRTKETKNSLFDRFFRSKTLRDVGNFKMRQTYLAPPNTDSKGSTQPSVDLKSAAKNAFKIFQESCNSGWVPIDQRTGEHPYIEVPEDDKDRASAKRYIEEQLQKIDQAHQKILERDGALPSVIDLHPSIETQHQSALRGFSIWLYKQFAIFRGPSHPKVIERPMRALVGFVCACLMGNVGVPAIMAKLGFLTTGAYPFVVYGLGVGAAYFLGSWCLKKCFRLYSRFMNPDAVNPKNPDKWRLTQTEWNKLAGQGASPVMANKALAHLYNLKLDNHYQLRRQINRAVEKIKSGKVGAIVVSKMFRDDRAKMLRDPKTIDHIFVINEAFVNDPDKGLAASQEGRGCGAIFKKLSGNIKDLCYPNISDRHTIVSCNKMEGRLSQALEMSQKDPLHIIQGDHPATSLLSPRGGV